jgi:large subunit ribosomal protein L9
MEVILLERVENLGQMGDVVKVRSGFARNFLLPQKRALRANESNKKIFESQRVDLEARNLERTKDAKAAAERIEGKAFILIRQASELGMLYGSVSTRDIAEAASIDGVHIERSQVHLDKPLKSLGVFSVRIVLHPEVDARVDVNIARSEDEAERQARGENVLASPEDQEKEADSTEAAPEFFDEGAQAAVTEEADSADANEDNA